DRAVAHTREGGARVLSARLAVDGEAGLHGADHRARSGAGLQAAARNRGRRTTPSSGGTPGSAAARPDRCATDQPPAISFPRRGPVSMADGRRLSRLDLIAPSRAGRRGSKLAPPWRSSTSPRGPGSLPGPSLPI